MTRALLLLALVLSLMGTATVVADEIVLTNGRVLRGEIVSQDDQEVVFRSGPGKLRLRRAVIAKIVSARTPLRELAARRKALAPDDAEGLRKLADWAASQGLGPQALELRGLARDLRLVQRMARAEKKRTAAAFVAVFHWGRRSGVDHATLADLLARARRLDDKDPQLISAQANYRAQLENEEKRLAKAAAALRRPRYRDPANSDSGRGLQSDWQPGKAITPPVSADALDERRKEISALKNRIPSYPRSRGAKR